MRLTIFCIFASHPLFPCPKTAEDFEDIKVQMLCQDCFVEAYERREGPEKGERKENGEKRESSVV
jgi:hypothetical protein